MFLILLRYYPSLSSAQVSASVVNTSTVVHVTAILSSKFPYPTTANVSIPVTLYQNDDLCISFSLNERERYQNPSGGTIKQLISTQVITTAFSSIQLVEFDIPESVIKGSMTIWAGVAYTAVDFVYDFVKSTL